MKSHDEPSTNCGLAATYTHGIQDCNAKKDRRHNNNNHSDEPRSAPDSPKVERRVCGQQRHQYQNHRAGSSSETNYGLRRSVEDLAKEEEESEKRISGSSNGCPTTTIAGSSNNSSGNNKKVMCNANMISTSSSCNTVASSSTNSVMECLNTNMSSSYANQPSSQHSLSSISLANSAPPPDESDSDFGHNQPSTSNSRARQKKFIKTFKHLPPEELVLQRYSCALVGDILLQGHLYLTHNYFAFYSNVFGYVTKLQIPIRSVTKITKEKTAKIIPNAVGICTEEGKHIFASLLSRDTTFKLMNRLWQRAMKELPTELDAVDSPENPLETELEDEEEFIHDEMSSDSDGTMAVSSVPLGLHHHHHAGSGVKDVPMDSTTYVMKRMSQTSGTLFFQQSSRGSNKASQTRRHISGINGTFAHNIIRSNSRSEPHSSSGCQSESNQIRRCSSQAPNPSQMKTTIGHMALITRSTIVALFIILLLVFLLCSSLYLVFRVEALQKQVESRYTSHMKRRTDYLAGSGSSMLSEKPVIQIQRELNDNVDQISLVRKNLEKLNNILDLNKKDET